MTDAILRGLLLGLTLAALIGPVFFALLQTSISKGFIAGLFLAIGISLSDFIYILLTNIFVNFLTKTVSFEFYLGVLGGFVLIIIGITTSLKKPIEQEPNNNNSIGAKRSVGLILKGFILNFAHPGVLIFWVGVVSLVDTKWGFSTHEKTMMFGTTILTVFSTDLLKSYLSQKIKKWMTYGHLMWMNRIMGIVLIGFGIYLLIATFWD
jgi:threonine/homoserine/homoserine lactone efflux protein